MLINKGNLHKKNRAISQLGAEKITFPPKPDIHTYRQTDIHTDRQTYIQRDIERDRQTDRQTGRQTDR